MDEISGFARLDVPRRMRYRVAVTVIDREAERASVEMYDTNTLERARGPKERDAFSGLLVQDVTLRLLAAHALTDGEGDAQHA